MGEKKNDILDDFVLKILELELKSSYGRTENMIGLL